MRLIVTKDAGIRYGGRLYAKGEEMELADSKRDRQWGAVFQAKRWAKKHEPVVLGTARRPAPAKPAPPPLPVTTQPEPPPPAVMTTQAAPEAHYQDGQWLQSPWSAGEPTPPPGPTLEEKVVLEEESSPESAEEAPVESTPDEGRRRGRSQRRDIRPEE